MDPELQDYNTCVTTEYLKSRDAAFVLYFSHHNKNHIKEFSTMASITQDMMYRLSLIQYAEKFGVTNAGSGFMARRAENPCFLPMDLPTQ